jgi:phospho-N-acetylmuramoyl-pentapeptide-transferase
MSKAGTPTMGGLLIVGVVLVMTVFTNMVDHWEVLLPLGVMGAVGAVGVLDDSLTLQGRERASGHERFGLLGKAVFFAAVGLVAGMILYFSLDTQSVNVPHYGEHEMSVGTVVVAALVIAATTSASAVTDGLDGLLGGLMLFAYGVYGFIAAFQGQGYLSVFCFTVVGALAGFLWFNAHPARVFMGETGALPLGAGLATVALMTGWWLLLPVIGIVLVAELASDLVQIGSFQLTGKRVLKMAPLHHHFELIGWEETQVVTRFWLVGIVGGMLGLALALTD